MAATGRRLASCAAGGVLVAGGMFAVSAIPAAADSFQQKGSQPVVDVTGSSFSVTPQNLATVTVKVTDLDKVSNLTSVALCMYTAGGSSDCSSTNNNDTVSFVWTRPSGTDNFELAAGSGSTWAKGTGGNASSTDFNATATELNITFKFVVGEVAKEGAWSIYAKATDAGAEVGEDTAASWMTVNWYGEVVTPRSAVDFGTVNFGGGNVTRNSLSDGVLQVNGAADVTLRAGGPFTGGAGSTTTTLAGGTPTDAVDSAEVALNCKSGSTYDDTGAIRLTTTAQTLQDNALTSPTAEGGASGLLHACKLIVGTGIGAGQYTSAVTLAVTDG